MEELRKEIEEFGWGHRDDDSFTCSVNYLRCSKCNLQHYKYVSHWPCRHPHKQFVEQECDCGYNDSIDYIMGLIKDYRNSVLDEVEDSVIGQDRELESRYDYDYKLAESTIKQHNKINVAINAEKAEMREALKELRAELK